MCVPGPPLFLLPTLWELKGSRDLLQGGGHMAIYPRCGFQGPKECQGLPSPLAEGAKIPARQMSTKKDYQWRQASLCQRG